jgi:hypothetical protein
MFVLCVYIIFLIYYFLYLTCDSGVLFVRYASVMYIVLILFYLDLFLDSKPLHNRASFCAFWLNPLLFPPRRMKIIKFNGKTFCMQCSYYLDMQSCGVITF